MGRRGSRFAAVALAATVLAAFGAIADAPAKKSKLPVVAPLPVANYVNGSGVSFAVEVHDADHVSISYASKRHKAAKLTIAGGDKQIVKFFWQADFKPGQRKKCYDITIAASNDHGTVTRNRKACRLGLQSGSVNQ